MFCLKISSKIQILPLALCGIYLLWIMKKKERRKKYGELTSSQKTRITFIIFLQNCFFSPFQFFCPINSILRFSLLKKIYIYIILSYLWVCVSDANFVRHVPTTSQRVSFHLQVVDSCTWVRPKNMHWHLCVICARLICSELPSARYTFDRPLKSPKFTRSTRYATDRSPSDIFKVNDCEAALAVCTLSLSASASSSRWDGRVSVVNRKFNQAWGEEVEERLMHNCEPTDRTVGVHELALVSVPFISTANLGTTLFSFWLATR